MVSLVELEAQLAAGDWLAATLETNQLLHAAAGLPGATYFTFVSVRDFPCEPLQAINDLWQGYSRDRFGFTAQYQLWTTVELADPLSNSFPNTARYRAFTEIVGWRESGLYREPQTLTFDLSAPVGHLPYVRYFYPLRPWLAWVNGYQWFFERFAQCESLI
ncbi:MAG: GUN4 domain-containing protein [Synechococcaceae cyanobacterium SM2_3_60]|nr:GUN4 domain-containing protein [Synechococcaceae cyanobacterium SM2_3_60]